MTDVAAGTWDPGQPRFEQDEICAEEDVSDSTSQSAESGNRETQSSNGDETETTDASMEPRRMRATLSKEQAAVIYALRPPHKDNPFPRHLAAGNSQLLSKWFGVSPKAVRDVWNRRTWAHATGKPVSDAVLDALPMIMEQQEKAARGGRRPRPTKPDGQVVRTPGRPIGSKDTKPRRRRMTTMQDSFTVGGRPVLPGIARDGIHNGMMSEMHSGMHTHKMEQMERMGALAPDMQGGSHSSRSTPPSPNDGGEALDYLYGSRWQHSQHVHGHPHAHPQGSSSMPPLVHGNGNGHGHGQGGWGMYEEVAAPSPISEELGGNAHGDNEGLAGANGPSIGVPMEGRSFPFYLSAVEMAANHAQQHHAQQLTQQPHVHAHARGGDGAMAPYPPQPHGAGCWMSGLETWRGGSSGDRATNVESGEWAEWARYEAWRGGVEGARIGMAGSPTGEAPRGNMPGIHGGPGGGGYYSHIAGHVMHSSGHMGMAYPAVGHYGTW
jgi:hypothetical protein